MITAPQPDPFEEWDRDLNEALSELEALGPITEDEIQAAIAWLASTPTAEV